MKDIPHSQFLSHLQKPVDWRMVQTDIQIGEAFLVDVIRHLLRLQVNGNPQRLQHAGAARPAGNTVIAMHQHRGTGRRRDNDAAISA